MSAPKAPLLPIAVLASSWLCTVARAEPALFSPSVPRAPALVPGLAAEGLVRVSFDKGDEEAQFIAGLARRGLHDIVVKESRDFLERRSSHRRAPAVRYRLADALFELKRGEEAIEQYRILDGVAGFEQAAEVEYRLGELLLDEDEPAEAAKYLGECLERGTDYLVVPATYLLAEALFRSGEFANARKAYEAVLALGERGKDYAREARYGATWSAWKAEDFDATVALAEAFLKAHADDAQAGELAFLAAEAHVEQDRPADALAWYARVDSGPYEESALRGAAFAEAARGEHARSAERFGAYLAKFPRGEFAAEAALQQGVQFVRADQFREALAALSGPAAVVDAQNRYWRSVAYAGIGDHDSALTEARAGLEARPDEALAAQLRIAAGDALFELDRGEEAAALYEASGSAYALHAAAVARLNDGDAAEAARLAQTLLSGAAREPGAEYRAEALLTRAEALFRLERYDEAEPVLRTMLAEASPSEDGAPPRTKASAPLVARATSRLAWCRWYADDAAGANALFTRLAENGNASADERSEAVFMAGRTALAAGDDEGAARQFRTYIAQNAQGPFAAESLLRLARLTEGAEGAKLYERLVANHPSSELVPAALSELAERRVAAGDTTGAAEAYARLSEQHADDPLAMNARYGLGWARYQDGDHAGAAAPLWQVAGSDDAPEELRTASYELLVWVEAKNERPDRVSKAFYALVPRVDDDARILEAARVLDGALVAAEDLEGRTKLWSDAASELEEPTALASARVEQGFAALDAEKSTEAARHAMAAREVDPDSPAVAELMFFVGESFYVAGDDERAAPLYVAASEHGAPEVAERALYMAGFSELRRGGNAAAAAAFARLVERFEAGVLAPESMFLAGEAHYRDEDFDEAAEWLRRMTKSAPKHASRPKALFRLGVAEGRLENWRESVDALAELIAANPEFESLTEAELWRGRALARLDEQRAARQSLSRVIESDEGVLAAQARIELGRLAEKQNDDEGAIAEYLKVAVLYGHAEECAEALVRAGDVLARTGKDEAAKARYEEVVADYPKTEWAETAKARLASETDGDGSGDA